MSKVWNYVITITGITILMQFAGLNNGVSTLLTFLGLNTSGGLISNSAFFIAISSLFTITFGASILIGLFSKSSGEYSLLAPFALASLILFVSTFVQIINQAHAYSDWIYYIVFTIFGVLGIGFLFALVEWVFGRDN